MSIFLAGLHFVALGLGFSGILLRGIRMREAAAGAPLKQVYLADNLWGLAAMLWIVTGLLRAFGGYEKGSHYYMHNHWFYAKMGIFVLLLVLELAPMITFIRWRVQKKTSVLEADKAWFGKLIFVNRVELALVLVIPFFASAMARGGLLH